MKRIFIAIRINPGERLTGAVESMKKELAGEHIRWVDMNQLHLTLAFLGDTEDVRINGITQFLDEIAESTEEFSFRITGLGVFRNLKEPRVIWAGIGSDEKLDGLYNSIKASIKELGIETEERPFIPHLTVGRVKSLKNSSILGKILDSYHDSHFQTVMVYEVILYESILGSSGPTYIPLHKSGMQSGCL